jgi:predicted O-methyltransferase YrrM
MNTYTYHIQKASPVSNALNESIIDAYSKIHAPIVYTNGLDISFEGSQIQKEFFTAWAHISDYFKKNPTDHISFLEVGAFKGLWAIAFCEFCKMHNIAGTYLTVTLIENDPGGNIPLYKTLEYLNASNIKSDLIDINTMDDNALPEVLKHKTSFNIVFIDADHSYNAVMSDISKFSSLADDILLFHDIRPIEANPSCGVYKAIIDSGLKLDTEIVTNEGIMGIGIIYKK